uniref:RING-type E3 ubiquitin transferase n=1 Tax=Alexandrium catenella TaxID=2925 RepID=A0A7S1WIB1_ALECA
MPQQQNDPRKTGPPPTSASALRSLPRIKVTAYDIAANESAECSICLDELVIGQPALRIPCGHLYHEDCVKDWLKKSNECPVCRFELPTDDAEYERGRKTRMAGRKLRMRHADLTVKSVQELSRLASFIGVDVRGCLEKSELVEKIAASSLVQIIPTDGVEVGGSPTSTADSSAPGRPSAFSQSQLDAMSIGEVRALMERLSVDSSDCAEKADMVRRLVLSGRILVSSEREAAATGSSAPSPGRLHTASSSSDVIMGGTEEAAAGVASANGAGNLSGKSVGELRRLAKQLGVSLDGCLEKVELVQRIEASPAFQQNSGS